MSKDLTDAQIVQDALREIVREARGPVSPATREFTNELLLVRIGRIVCDRLYK